MNDPISRGHFHEDRIDEMMESVAAVFVRVSQLNEYISRSRQMRSKRAVEKAGVFCETRGGIEEGSSLEFDIAGGVRAPESDGIAARILDFEYLNNSINIDKLLKIGWRIIIRYYDINQCFIGIF